MTATDAIKPKNTEKFKVLSSGYFDEASSDVKEFLDVISDTLPSSAVPHAASVVHQIPLYDMPSLQTNLSDSKARQTLMAEWADVLLNRSGVLVLKQAITDHNTLDEAKAVFENLIAQEKADSGAKADHFAAAGSNDRLWNSVQKLAADNPELYARYFAQPSIDAICESWLGPCYQMTAQINVVHPGGAAQDPHRDYHLGFQSKQQRGHFPSHVHALSPVLTLQGAIAHVDMPLNSGPTQLLPFSQRFAAGYMAYGRADFRDCFAKHFVQLPLDKGDALFLRAMETIDRASMCEWIYPVLLEKQQNNALSDAEMHAVIAATAEGYSFPTNLDTDPPVGGLAPETQQQLIVRCLADGTSLEDFRAQMAVLMNKQKA